MSRTALYRLFDAEDALLYIGITGSPKMRFKAHAGDKPWWSAVARQSVDWFSDRPSARAAELAAIAAEMPVHNFSGKPGWTPRKPIPEGCMGIGEARTRLAELVTKALYLDTSTVLIRNGRRVAVLVSVEYFERAEAALKLARESADS